MLLNFRLRKQWNSLCCLVGHTGRSMEDSAAKCGLKCGCLNQEVSEENNLSM